MWKPEGSSVGRRADGQVGLGAGWARRRGVMEGRTGRLRWACVWKGGWGMRMGRQVEGGVGKGQHRQMEDGREDGG